MNLLKEKGFEKFPSYLVIVLTQLGFESDMSFAHLSTDMKELHLEIEKFVSGINTSAAPQEVKTTITDEITRLWQKIESFNLPTGHKKFLEGLRCHCASKVNTCDQNKNIIMSKRSTKPGTYQFSTEKLRDLVSKYLGSLPEEMKEKENEIQIQLLNDETWTASCPFCESIISIQMRKKSFVASNYKRHIETHTASFTDSQENLPTSEQTSDLPQSSSQNSTLSLATTTTNSESVSSFSDNQVRPTRKRNNSASKSDVIDHPNKIKGLDRFQVKRKNPSRNSVRKLN